MPQSQSTSSSKTRWLIALGLLGLVATLIVAANRSKWWQAEDETLTFTAKKSTLHVNVTERGTLESQNTVDGRCQLERYENKIIFIVPEGTMVTEGDPVVRFDNSEIVKEIATQKVSVNDAKGKVEAAEQTLEVEKNQAESDIQAAKLEETLAKLDLKKYIEGDYEFEKYKAKGELSLAEAEVKKLELDVANTQELVRKGFREPDQLKELQQRFESAKFYAERDKQALANLEEFTLIRQRTELSAKAEEAGRKVVRAEASARAKIAKASSEFDSAKALLTMEEKTLAEYEDQLLKCEIKAPQAGIVAYGNEDYYGRDRQIREGATVYRRQKIFSLPDLTKMQVKVKVHESVVKKVKKGQKAKIRVSAHPNVVIEATVEKVALLADSSNSWRRGGVKEYETIVTIDKLPEEDLKPGMNAEVEILVGEYPDVLLVPVQAVTEHDRQHYVYAKQSRSFERIPIEVGESNHKMIEITDGIEKGTDVALDARSRALADFADEDIVTEESNPKDDDPSPTADAQKTASS